MNFLIGQRLSINRICVVDSTALTLGARKSLLGIGRKYRVRTELFLFDIALEKCLERDRARPRPLGPKVVEEQYQLFTEACRSVRSEGFDQIVELREDDLQSVRCEILYRPINPLNPYNSVKRQQNTAVLAKVPEPRS